MGDLPNMMQNTRDMYGNKNLAAKVDYTAVDIGAQSSSTYDKYLDLFD